MTYFSQARPVPYMHSQLRLWLCNLILSEFRYKIIQNAQLQVNYCIKQILMLCAVWDKTILAEYNCDSTRRHQMAYLGCLYRHVKWCIYSGHESQQTISSPESSRQQVHYTPNCDSNVTDHSLTITLCCWTWGYIHVTESSRMWQYMVHSLVHRDTTPVLLLSYIHFHRIGLTTNSGNADPVWIIRVKNSNKLITGVK